MWFRQKVQAIDDPVESRFDSMMTLIKDLPRTDYNRLKKAMDLGYDAYQTVKKVQAEEEKDEIEIAQIEKQLEKEVNK